MPRRKGPGRPAKKKQVNIRLDRKTFDVLKRMAKHWNPDGGRATRTQVISDLIQGLS